MVAEDVQFYGKIHIFYPTAIRHVNMKRRKVQNAVDPCQDELVCDALCVRRRNGYNPDSNISFLEDFFKTVCMLDDEVVGKSVTDFLGIHIKGSHKPVSLFEKVGMADEG
jgi:hypothetical protein